MINKDYTDKQRDLHPASVSKSWSRDPQKYEKFNPRMTTQNIKIHFLSIEKVFGWRKIQVNEI